VSVGRAARLLAAAAVTLSAAGAIAAPGLAATGKRAVLEIKTVPRVSGMTFELDGRRFASRGDGIARIEWDGRTALRDRLVAVPTETRPGIRAFLGRWYGNLDRPGQSTLTAALGLSYAVKLSFTNLREEQVASKRVSSVTLRSSTGIVYRFKGDEVRKRQWIQGVRTVSTPAGPREKDILISVDRVIVDGANVVNRAQQRFLPRRQDTVEVALLFYSARFSARDALFRLPLGSGVKLLHPDGRWTYHAFGSSAEVVVDGLARGDYSVEVDGPGISFLRPVTLSRDQEVELEVLSYADIGLAVGILVATALGLLYIGRPHLFARLKPRSIPGLAGSLGGIRSRDPSQTLAVRERGANEGAVVSANGNGHSPSQTRAADGTAKAGSNTKVPQGRRSLKQILDDLEHVMRRVSHHPGVTDEEIVEAILAIVREHPGCSARLLERHRAARGSNSRKREQRAQLLEDGRLVNVSLDRTMRLYVADDPELGHVRVASGEGVTNGVDAGDAIPETPVPSLGSSSSRAALAGRGAADVR